MPLTWKIPLRIINRANLKRLFRLPHVSLSLLTLSAFLSTPAIANDTIRVLSYNYMPFVGDNGVVNELANNYCLVYDKPCRFLELPVNKASQLYGTPDFPLLLGSMDIIPKEKQQISGIYPLIKFDATVFYLHKEKTQDWENYSYEDLRDKQLTVGVIRGLEGPVKKLRNERGIKIIKANTFYQLLRMLLADQIDFISGSPLSALHHIEKEFPDLKESVRFLPPYYSGIGGLLYLKDSIFGSEENKGRVEEFLNSPLYKEIINEALEQYPMLSADNFLVSYEKPPVSTPTTENKTVTSQAQ